MDNIIYSPSGIVSLQISEDKMSAWIVINRSEKIVNEQEIMDLIDSAGICYGFDEALAWIAEQGFEKDFDKPFPIAMCKPSMGQQKLNILFDDVNTYNPELAWSLAEIRLWTFVQQGAVLADLSYNLFSEGGSIYNVLGEITKLEGTAFDLLTLAGDNVFYDAEHHCLASNVTGYPYKSGDGRLHVIDSLEYHGDIRDVTDPVILAASVTINGSVYNSKLTIMKDVHITGNVESTEIYTEGNLTVEGDIVTSQNSGIVVMKNLSVQNIFSSIVTCKGRLTFHNDISGSKVIGEQSIIGNPDFSSIVGSQIQTSGYIETAIAGNASGLDTELEVCISPYTKERMTQMTKVLVRLKDYPEQNADRIEEINRELQQMEVTLSDDLNRYLNRDNSAERYIKVHRELHHGVYIRILKKSFTIKSRQSYSEFTE